MSSWYRLSHGRTGKDKSSKFGSSQIKSGHVKGRVKSSYCKSSQVGIGYESDRKSEIFWTQNFLDLKLKCFGPNTFLEQKSFWFKNVLENGV